MRRPAAFLCVIALCCTAAPATAQGTIDIQTTPFPTAVVVDVTIVDNGQVLGCTNFYVQRRTYLRSCQTYVPVFTIARQPGTTSTHQFIDLGVEPNTAYVYRVVACSAFIWVHDCGWGLGIYCPTTTGPGPTPIGRGRLVTDGSIVPYDLLGCDGCSGGGVQSLPLQAIPYVDSGTEVVLYGSFALLPGCQFGWALAPSLVVAQACTVAAERSTWSHVKALFH